MTGTAVRLLQTRAELASWRAAAPGELAVVMTMGALHAGHAALVREARGRARTVLVTVFLNPLQFAPGEDLSRYPRRLDADLRLCEREGVDAVFAPAREVVYPDGVPSVAVSAGPLGDVLEGEHRPGHFDGVLTVVLKLLHLTRPHLAYFGQKDAQQLLLIRRMCRDLDVPVEIVSVPTVREDDGLALSSRNGYLTAADRPAALALARALSDGAANAGKGPDEVRSAARRVLDATRGVRVDYLALVDPDTLAPLPADFAGMALLAVAARVGSTRLIDNVLVSVGPPGPGVPSAAGAPRGSVRLSRP